MTAVGLMEKSCVAAIIFYSVRFRDKRVNKNGVNNPSAY